MSDRPSFQFYPKDWRNNAKLQRCSIESRGAWVDVMCLLHDSDEYGVLRWPLVDIAQAVRLPVKLLRELAAKGVLKGADAGAEDYVHRPFHAGKYGEPVTLVAAGEGPVWYCSRFVKDEWLRHQRGKGTRFSAENPPPKATPKPSPKVTPTHRVGERQGDGPSSASASPIQQELTGTTYPAAEPPVDDKPLDPIWGKGRAYLARTTSLKPSAIGAFLGKLRKEAGDIQTAAILADAEAQAVSDPVSWLVAAARNAGARKAKPSVSDDFRGKTYASTADDDLPESLR